jgi:hypothetical protein
MPRAAAPGDLVPQDEPRSTEDVEADRGEIIWHGDPTDGSLRTPTHRQKIIYLE